MYCRRIGILPCTIPTLVLPEHVQGHEVRQEFLAELALAIPPELARAISPELAHAIPPELAPSLVLALSLALPDLVGALDGGHPPLPCSLYYLGCPTDTGGTRLWHLFLLLFFHGGSSFSFIASDGILITIIITPISPIPLERIAINQFLCLLEQAIGGTSIP